MAHTGVDGLVFSGEALLGVVIITRQLGEMLRRAEAWSMGVRMLSWRSKRWDRQGQARNPLRNQSLHHHADTGQSL